MLQDHKGQMWFGSYDGLSLFNGERFKTFKSNPGQDSGLEDFRVDKIVEDTQGYLWLKTYAGRIYRFDPRTERFLKVPQCNQPFRNYQPKLNSIYSFPDGSVWLSGGEDGCFRVTNDGENVKINHLDDRTGTLKSKYIHEVFQDKSGKTWILTEKGLDVFKSGKPVRTTYNEHISTNAYYAVFEGKSMLWFGGNNGEITAYKKSTASFENISIPVKSPVIALKEISDDEIFILTRHEGYLTYNFKTKNFCLYNTFTNPQVLSNEYYSCYMDSQHNIWLETEKPSIVYFEPAKKKINNFTVGQTILGTKVSLQFFVIEDKNHTVWVHPRFGGFSKYDRKNNQLIPLGNLFNNSDRRFSDQMHTAYSDQQGNLWLSPLTRGLEKVVFIHSAFNFHKPHPETEGSLSNEIRAIFQDGNERIWVSARDGAITIFDKYHNRIGNLCNDGSIGKGVALNSVVYCITQDSKSTIWIGSKGNGLFKLEKTANSDKYKITHFINNPEDEYSLSSNNVYSVFEDKSHRIWICTYGGGINLLEQHGEKIAFIHAGNKLKGYPMDACSRTRYMTQDKNGIMYVGTTGGLIVFKNDKIDNLRFTLTRHEPSNKTSISGNDIHYILPAKDGKLYFATFGGGLSVLEKPFDFKSTPVFKSYTLNNGAPTNVFYTLKEDSHGNIWYSGQTSIGKLNPQNSIFETYKPFNRSVYTYAEGTACVTKEGEMLYGTTEGYVSFDLDRPLKSNFVPRIVFGDLQLFNKPVEVGVEGSPLKTNIDNTAELVLSHKQNIITINYSALDYTNPSNIQYAYMLEGFDKEWNYVRNLKFATYTNLPKGRYVFRVKSTNADGSWMNNERSLVIIREPSFWESIWGYILYFVASISIILLAVWVLYKFFILRTNVEIEHKLTNMKLQFFTDISHELRTPLTLIASPVDHILKSEPMSESAKKQLEMVQRNVDRLMRLITQILDFRKIQSNKMKLHIEQVPVSEIVGEIGRSFHQLADEHKIDFRIIDHTQQVSIWVDKDKFEKIFFNLLSNAFKFTQPEKSISIIIREDSNHVYISVKDNGMGITRDKVRFLFERFESFVNANVGATQGTGIGLALTKELVELHQGKITLDTEAGQGSEFTVSFKKGKEHFAEADFIHEENTLPAEKTAEMPEEDTQTNDIPTTDENDANEKPLILIVEDNPELREFLSSVLSKKYTILEAENGVKALAVLDNEIPDMIITDVMMPEMNGLELSKAIKEDIRISHIPIVLLTARTDLDVKLEALQYGVDDYITKPFSSTYLEARIENILTLRKQLQELYRSSLTNGVKYTSGIKSGSKDELFIQNVMNFMEENLQNFDLTVDDMATHLALGRSTFFKKLKGLIGISPIEFLKDFRLQKAAQLIETGEYNFTEISYMVGISDSSYFSRCFKQKFGLTPREYKDSKQ